MSVKLTALPRDTRGTRAARRSRAAGRVPAVVYGLGADPVAVTVDRRELRRALSTDAGSNALLDLDVDGTPQLAVVKDVQRHPVRREVTHVDFLRVDVDARIDVDVPVHLEGEASAITQAGGITEQRLTLVTVSVKPTDIPEFLSVDISGMTLDTVVTVAELELPEGVEMVTPGEQPVVTASLTRAAVADTGEGEGEGEGEAGEGAAEGAAGGAEEPGDAE
jgi:large subunit ribosomal protein L25